MNLGRLTKAWQSFSPRWRKRISWIAGGIIAYTLIGFLILPLIVRAVAIRQLRALLDRDVTIQAVRINPYTLSGSIRGFLIKDKDGEPLASWGEAYANFQLVSLMGKSWVFKEVRLVKPFGRLQINPDRSLNISDLATKFSQPAQEPGARQPGKQGRRI